jgi:uncharacterized membrane protein
MNTIRFWEIDAVRGIAISMMVIYHLIFDLVFFGIVSFSINSPYLWFFARITAFIFIFVVGVSLTLSYNRATMSESENKQPKFSKYLKRGLRIFALGVLVSIVTWIFIPSDLIVFGVLHFIGIVIILEYPFIGRKYLNLFIGVFIFIMALFVSQIYVNWPWLIWLGIKPISFQTVDYFPLIPWMGVVSLGIFFGNVFYKNYKRQFSLPDLSDLKIVRGCTFLGRHSLLIYLIHQPVLIIILILLGAINLNLFIK